MFCKTTCFVSIVFLIANIYVMLNVDKNELKDNFVKLLNFNQKNLYESLIKERRNIYFQGYALGLLFSIIYLFYIKQFLNKKINNILMVCTVGFIVFLTNYFYYILIKKSTYMIEHLNNKEQIKAWLDIYRSMQVRYHIGLVLGIFAAMIFAASNRC
jgi:primosomal protein N'